MERRGYATGVERERYAAGVVREIDNDMQYMQMVCYEKGSFDSRYFTRAREQFLENNISLLKIIDYLCTR